MNGQQHTVKKFSLELQTQGREHSYVLQRKCIKMVNESLVDVMDEILSTGFPDDELVRINKIEIDLGNLTTAELESDFINRCIAEFTSKIKAIPKRKKQITNDDGTIISTGENNIKEFLYFLATGKIHWAITGMDFQQWQITIIAAIKSNPVFFKQELSRLIPSHAVIERLVSQCEDAVIETLVTLYQPDITKEFSTLLPLLKNDPSYKKNDLPGKGFLIKLLTILFYSKTEGMEHAASDMLNAIHFFYATNETWKVLGYKEKIIAFIEKLQLLAGTSLVKEEFTLEVSDKLHSKKEEKKSQQQNEKESEDENYSYISNAGLIILHPFLQNIFVATGLMQNEDFINTASQQTAVHILQYMINGEQQAPEYIMPLNKILCGLGEEEHIDRFIQLEEAAIKEADALLEAVVSHWVILKNTSVAGMQETFFQRKAKLSFNAADKFWKLQVERKAVDLLLDKIPWGISYIKLPWMKYTLVTEW